MPALSPAPAMVCATQEALDDAWQVVSELDLAEPPAKGEEEDAAAGEPITEAQEEGSPCLTASEEHQTLPASAVEPLQSTPDLHLGCMPASVATAGGRAPPSVAASSPSSDAPAQPTLASPSSPPPSTLVLLTSLPPKKLPPPQPCARDIQDFATSALTAGFLSGQEDGELCTDSQPAPPPPAPLLLAQRTGRQDDGPHPFTARATAAAAGQPLHASMGCRLLEYTQDALRGSPQDFSTHLVSWLAVAAVAAAVLPFLALLALWSHLRAATATVELPPAAQQAVLLVPLLALWAAGLLPSLPVLAGAGLVASHLVGLWD